MQHRPDPGPIFKTETRGRREAGATPAIEEAETGALDEGEEVPVGDHAVGDEKDDADADGDEKDDADADGDEKDDADAELEGDSDRP